jgi:hypothetical protein
MQRRRHHRDQLESAVPCSELRQGLPRARKSEKEPLRGDHLALVRAFCECILIFALMLPRLAALSKINDYFLFYKTNSSLEI